MIASLLLTVLALPAAPAPKATKSIGPAPIIVVVAAPTGPEVTVAVCESVTVQKTFETTVVENGVAVVRKQTRDVTESIAKVVSLADLGATYRTGDDKPLTAAQVAERLKAGGHLIAPANREPIDPAYRKVLAPTAIVVQYNNDGKMMLECGASGAAIPVFAAVKADDKGVLRIPARGTREEIVKLPVTKEVDGVPKVEFIESKRTVHDLVPTPYDDVKPDVTTAEGKPVDADTAKKRMAAGEIVLISADGKPVAEAFLKLVSSGTLVLRSDKMVHPLRAAAQAKPVPSALPAIVDN
jgi:hypothetical protein